MSSGGTNFKSDGRAMLKDASEVLLRVVGVGEQGSRLTSCKLDACVYHVVSSGPGAGRPKQVKFEAQSIGAL